MIILGLNCSHNATASLLIDGKVVACIQEERLTRVKNQAGLPVLAVEEVLKIANKKIEDIDYVALNFQDPKIHLGYSTFSGEKGRIVKYNYKNIFPTVLSYAWKLKEEVLIRFPSTKNFIDKALDIYYQSFVDPNLKNKVLDNIKNKLGIEHEKVIWVDHHTAHAYSAIYSDTVIKNPLLVFTLDSMGDGLCATVSIFKNGKLKTTSKTPSGNSIGDLYTQTTAYLGMKLGEHEYKVMGLAPYADKNYTLPLLEKMRKLVKINRDLSFSTSVHSHMFYKILPSLFAYFRFDNISGALQTLTEEVLEEWISLGIKKTGIKDIACGGGVFMNVKANQKITELKDLRSFRVAPSSADESTAIGAAMWVYETKSSKPCQPLTALYLGGEFSDDEIIKTLKKHKKIKYKGSNNIEFEIAQILSKGEVVARCNGRMEFGARALGNRSILSHPSNLNAIREINSQIKSRDFWMPFAPSILEEEKNAYFTNKKKVNAPYMMITFDSTKDGKEKFAAAMHQYDFTLRPQIVYKDWNPGYYKVISEFKKITGIGGILNTSFNLHGYPIVYTPEDAIYVFENSGLKYLALGNFLLFKN